MPPFNSDRTQSDKTATKVKNLMWVCKLEVVAESSSSSGDLYCKVEVVSDLSISKR